MKGERSEQKALERLAAQRKRDHEKHACRRCSGSGVVSAASVDPLGMMRGEAGCPDCGGHALKAGTGRADRVTPTVRCGACGQVVINTHHCSNCSAALGRQ
jgi:hypothetical protein